jgi:hypothetical protein
MKTLTAIICVLLLAGQVFSQRTPENTKLVIMTPTPHDPNIKSRLKNTEVKSFYKSKADWQHIIDTTWGPGLPFAEKLNVFDYYANYVRAHNPTFTYTKLNWDSVAASWRSKITDSTSRGGFSAILSYLASLVST